MRLRACASWRPRAVLSDPYLLNILAYREDTLGRSILPIYREAVEDSALVARIHRHLGAR